LTVRPSRDRQGIQDRLAALQQLHDVLHGCARLDLVFACLQAAVGLVDAQPHQEDAGVADDAFPLKQVGDLARAGIGLDENGFGRRRRAGADELAIAEIEHAAGDEHRENNE